MADSGRPRILTVSDRAARGIRPDLSGPALADLLADRGFDVADQAVVPDAVTAVAEALIMMSRSFCGLIVTTGGTGFAPTDVTPEATASVIEREAPGLAEAMRAADPRGALTRGRAGTVDRALVVNVPGSPDGAVETLAVVLDVIPHALELLSGGHPH